ncbi:MAG: CHAT domain-containing protein [Bradymonadia bacterium]
MLIDGCIETIIDPVQSSEAVLQCARQNEAGLTLWIEGEAHALSIPRTPFETSRDSTIGGTRLTFAPPQAADSIHLELSASHPLGIRRQTIKISLLPPPSIPGIVEKVMSAKKAGEIDEALRIAETKLSADAEPATLRRLASLRARLLLLKGQAVEGLDALLQAANAHWKAGEVSLALSDMRAKWFTQADRDGVVDIPAVYQRPHSIVEAKHAILEKYISGYSAYKSGKLRDSLSLLERSMLLSKYTNRADLRVHALNAIGMAYRDSGRFTEGLEMVRTELESGKHDLCTQQALLANTIWLTTGLLRSSSTTSAVREEVSLAHSTVSAFEKLQDQARCYGPDALASVFIDSAFLMLYTEANHEAKRLLDLASNEQVGPKLSKRSQEWYLIVHSMYQFQAGLQEEAIQNLQDQINSVGEEIDKVTLWDLQMTLGMLASENDDHDLAIKYLRASEETKALILSEIRLKGDTDVFLGAYAKGASLLARELYAIDDDDALMDHVRRTRSSLMHLLSPLSESSSVFRSRRERYEQIDSKISTLSKETNSMVGTDLVKAQEKLLELATQKEEIIQSFSSVTPTSSLERPPPGELFITFIPSEGGWILISEDESSTQANYLVQATLETDQAFNTKKSTSAGTFILSLLKNKLMNSHSVRIFPYGSLKSIDFHSSISPVTGRPLYESHIVKYGLDLPPRRNENGEVSVNGLVVQNPTENLDGADREGELVFASLSRASWKVDRLKGSMATKTEMIEHLQGKSLLHYAGHGVHHPDGWSSYLSLAQGTRLTTQDIIGLGIKMPTVVLLSGCETGLSSDRSPVETLGLAHAFILSGSKRVIATTRPINDAMTVEFADHFYQSMKSTSDVDIAFQKAIQASARKRPEGDWAAFRVFAP